MSREEQDRLIRAARQTPEPTAFGVIFDPFTGLRLGELCGLRWQNVDMEQGTFQVCETRNRLPNHDDSIAASTTVKTVSSTKTDHSRRTVYLLDELFQDLKYYKEIQDSIAAEYPGYNAIIMRAMYSARRMASSMSPKPTRTCSNAACGRRGSGTQISTHSVTRSLPDH